jgi:TPR repeat protein
MHSVLLAVALLAAQSNLFAQAAAGANARPTGTYAGQYQCGAQGYNFTVRVTRVAGGTIQAEAVFPQQVILYSPRPRRADRTIKMNGTVDRAGTLTLRSEEELILAYNQTSAKIRLHGQLDSVTRYLVGTLDYPTCDRFALVPGPGPDNHEAAATYLERMKGQAESDRAATQAPVSDHAAVVAAERQADESPSSRAAAASVAPIATASAAVATPPQPVAASPRPPTPPVAAASSSTSAAADMPPRGAQAAVATQYSAIDESAAQRILARARGGDVEAMIETAWLLLEGRWLTRDLPSAARWYRMAAEQGQAVAMNNLGWMYEQGIGVTQDVDQARRWYEQAVSKNQVPAMRNLAQLLVVGSGASELPEARNWYERQRAADKRCPDCAPLHAPRPAPVVDADRRATALYRRASEAGDMRATALLGSLYLTGRANDQGKPDAEQFRRLSTVAAQAGDTQGMWQLFVAYNGYVGVPRDDAAAIRWLRSAAEGGDIRAMNALASECQQGTRVPRDEIEAMNWWRRAAEDGDGGAMTQVAYGYLNGTGGLPKNIPEGVRWTRAAVRAEDLEAASWLARSYEDAGDQAAATEVWTQLARSADPEKAMAAASKLREQKQDRLFREMREQSKKTAWDFLAETVKVAAVFSAFAAVKGALDGSLNDLAADVDTGRSGSSAVGLGFGAGSKNRQQCGFVSRSFMTVHGSKSIMGGPGTMWTC